MTAYSVCAVTAAAAAAAIGLDRQQFLLFLSNNTTATTNIVLDDDLPGASSHQRLADACVKIVRNSIIALVGVVELVC